MTEIKLKIVKKTPGTVVYGQVTSAGAFVPKDVSLIPSLYIKKSAFEGKLPPAFVTVVIDE